MSRKPVGTVNVLHTTRLTGYFTVPFSKALACAKNTDGDSLTFLTNTAAFVIITVQSASDMTQKTSLLRTNFILTVYFVQHVTILEENVGM